MEKKEKYLFSIVIPVYNAEKYLEETVESVIAQDIGFEKNIQIILVNDGSKDSSAEICQRYADKYPNNVVFLQNYDVNVAGFMTKGCDIWLGNPEIPLEACSTSGMKAASNGVINVSTADGWWYRSCRYGVNGWTIGESSSRDKYTDAQYLYNLLEEISF